MSSLTSLQNNTPATITLTASEFTSLARALWLVARHFKPLEVAVHNSVITACPPSSGCVVHVDLKKLIKPDVNLRFQVDKAVLGQLRGIRGSGNVEIIRNSGANAYQFRSTHVDHWLPFASGAGLPEPPAFDGWVGVPVEGYMPCSLKAYLGKSSSANLLFYGLQLEAITRPHQAAPFVFTAAMKQELAGKDPDLSYYSRMAFAFYGTEQRIKIGRQGDAHWVVVENRIDHDVQLIVHEKLV